MKSPAVTELGWRAPWMRRRKRRSEIGSLIGSYREERERESDMASAVSCLEPVD